MVPSPRLIGHLVRRFAGSLWPGGPSAADEAWAQSFLGDGERSVWARMSGPDRRHAVGVARRVPVSLVPAALLHDCGKVESRLGTFGRVVATVYALVAGRDRAARGDGRIGRYLRHDAIGASLLSTAGSSPLTVSWAREHHLPSSSWTVPVDAGAALKAADDD